MNRQAGGGTSGQWWQVLLLVAVICSVETALRLGPNSPDTRYTLPQYSLGDFWNTPLGWTGLVGGAPVNRDSVQFASLAGFFRDESVLPVPLQDNVYTRFGAYPLLGAALAPLVGSYASFVLVNLAFWIAAALATYALAHAYTRNALVGWLAAVMVSTAPVFEALVGQALPYVASYSVFALSLLLFYRARLFELDTAPSVAIAAGVASGAGFLLYDLYMVPAFVLVYGLLRRMPLRNLALILVAMAAPRLAWSLYWQAAHLASYSHNETHPAEALAAWLDTARGGDGLARIKDYALLAAHGALNIGAAFLFWPVALAGFELAVLARRRATEALWFVAVLVGGFAPALFMLSTWPHIPRWYGYGFVAVYILAAAGAVRIARWMVARGGAASADAVPRAAGLQPGANGASGVQVQPAVTRRALAVVLTVLIVPVVLIANLDVLGASKPMELLLFQPAHWSYLWSR